MVIPGSFKVMKTFLKALLSVVLACVLFFGGLTVFADEMRIDPNKNGSTDSVQDEKSNGNESEEPDGAENGESDGTESEESDGTESEEPDGTENGEPDGTEDQNSDGTENGEPDDAESGDSPASGNEDSQGEFISPDTKEPADTTEVTDESEEPTSTSESINEPTTTPAETAETTGVTNESAEDYTHKDGQGTSVGIIIAVCAVIVIVIAAVLALLTVIYIKNKKRIVKDGDKDKEKSESLGNTRSGEEIKVAKLHNIGKRKDQQDCLGTVTLANGKGVLAVVADGMGGLTGGDQVSQTIVKAMISHAGTLSENMDTNQLNPLLKMANDSVNQQLGESGLYKSGSTVVATLVQNREFHWISVGDSRIYLYRSGSLIQLNQEHTLETELLQKVMNGEITQEDAKNDPQRKRLTSFIGMGRLKHIDSSVRKTALLPGDVIILMTDGVFNRTSDSTIASIISKAPDLSTAAEKLEEHVKGLNDPSQDNFTAVLVGY